ncbi:MAG: tyrosine-type recombinase/integrase [Planctomycetes bacterium]|nr:tyrosine-type recombinase/integrase [Planctomycetota bacterium]
MTTAVSKLEFTALDAEAVGRLMADFRAARSPHTLRAYEADLAAFATHAGASTVGDAVRELLSAGPGAANSAVLRYKDRLLTDELAPATINRRLAALRSVVRVARLVGLITWSIEIPGLRTTPYRDTRGPGRAGFQRLVQLAADQAEPKRSRDLAILWLLYGRALRREEIASLDLEHLDMVGARVRVMGKHRREREWLTVPPATIRSLAEWLAVRGDSQGPLFHRVDRAAAMAGDRGRLTAKSIERLVSDLGKRLGLRVRPHGLRHAAITEVLDVTRGDFRTTQRFGRLQSANVLRFYDDNREDLGGEASRLIAP